MKGVLSYFLFQMSVFALCCGWESNHNNNPTLNDGVPVPDPPPRQPHPVERTHLARHQVGDAPVRRRFHAEMDSSRLSHANRRPRSPQYQPSSLHRWIPSHEDSSRGQSDRRSSSPQH